MTRLVLCCASVLSLATAVVPAQAADNCEARIQALEGSDAEGAERLAAKNEAVEICGRQYKRDKTIQALVKECARYIEQPVIKQLLVTECQLAAYGYANALRTLKAEYRK